MTDRFHILKGLILLSLTGCMLASCVDVRLFERKENLKINKISFSEDYRTARILTTIDRGFEGNLSIDSIGSNVTVTEFLDDRLSHHLNNKSLSIEKVRNLTAERFDSIGLGMLVVVDLTLPQESVNAERNAVEQVRRAFCHDNLYVSFLKSGGVTTPTELLSDFVLDNSFIEDPGDGDKYLYRGILDKIRELGSGKGPLAGFRNKVLLVMSDGNVWGEYEPYDPEHFASQRKLDEFISSNVWKDCFFYCNFNPQNQDDILYEGANKTILALCSKTGGTYQEKFNWFDCCNSLEEHFGLAPHDYLLYLQNPDGRQYEGVARRVLIDVRDESDSLALSGSALYNIGNEFFPIIINGVSDRVATLRGAILLLAILFAAFITFQFVVPRILYRRFKKKYLVPYTGPTMCVDGVSVADTCYLCKAPFKEGDMVVAKCEHAMHEECWDENGYHCPEYSSRCKHGSHYYNHSDLLDPNNAPYYAKWIYCALGAAVVGWLIFYLCSGQVITSLARDYVENTYQLQPGSQAFIDRMNYYNSYMSYLPAFSFSLGVPMVLFMALIIESRREWWKRIIFAVVRTIAVGTLAFVLFSFNTLFCLTVDMFLLQEAAELFCWTVFTFGAAFCLTFRSYVAKPGRRFYILLLSAVLVAFIWPYVLETIDRDYRSLIAIVYLVYNVLFTLAIVTSAPRSNRYVLHVEGCVKTTDIALYKWFRANPDAVVSIGRSVDCSIQLSWDIKSDVAPKQAEVYMRDGNCYLRALEDGVIVGKKKSALKPGDSLRLYQESAFMIGSTSFTYRETDL